MKTFNEFKDQVVTEARDTVTIDVNWVDEDDVAAKLSKQYGIKIKITGKQSADVTGPKDKVAKFLIMQDYDQDEIEELYPELFETLIIPVSKPRTVTIKANIGQAMTDSAYATDYIDNLATLLFNGGLTKYMKDTDDNFSTKTAAKLKALRVAFANFKEEFDKTAE